MRLIFAALVLLVAFPSAPAEEDSEPQTMRELLSEVRQLRRDLQSVAVSARRGQVLIYRLHEQHQATEQAKQRADNAKATREQIESQLRYETEELKQAEETRNGAENDANQKQVDKWIAQISERIEVTSTAAQEWRSKEIEMEAELRTEREKLDRFEEELDQLSKELESSSVQARAQ